MNSADTLASAAEHLDFGVRIFPRRPTPCASQGFARDHRVARAGRVDFPNPSALIDADRLCLPILREVE